MSEQSEGLKLVSTENEQNDTDKKIQERITELKEIRKKIIEDGNTAIDKFTNEIKFFLTSEMNIYKKLLQFLKTSASWKFTEAVWLNETVKNLKEAKILENIEGCKSGYYIDNRTLETIQFFISKVEGNGLYVKLHANDLPINFETYINIIDAVQKAMILTAPYKNGMKKVEEMLKDLDYIIQSVEHGVEVTDDQIDKDVFSKLPELKQYIDKDMSKESEDVEVNE